MLNRCACCGDTLSLRERLECLWGSQPRTLAYVNGRGELCTVRGRWFCTRCIYIYWQEPDWRQAYVREHEKRTRQAALLQPAGEPKSLDRNDTYEIEYSTDEGRTWISIRDCVA